MNSSNYRFMLDLHSTQSQISLPVMLGDTSRVFYISLADGGVPYIIEDGCLAMVSIKRPTGTFIKAFCAIEKNTTIKYDFAQDEITNKSAVVVGVHECEVTLYDAEDGIIGSPRFSMVVSDRVVNRDDINLSDDDITAIDAMLLREAARQSAEIGRVNAEAARVDAETNRSIRFNSMIKDTTPTVTEINLPVSAWVGEDSPYSQVVEIAGVTARSKVDLQPTIEQLAIFHDKDIAFVTENEDGVVTVYVIGDKPTRDYAIQATITEVLI